MDDAPHVAGERPYGRDAVMDSLLTAAADLFSARGVDGVSVRDIAEQAGVNHALLHRHFGSKEDLFKALLERGAAEFTAVAASFDDPGEATTEIFHAMAEREWFWRVLAYAILSGRDPAEMRSEQGLIGSTLARLLEGDASPAADGDALEQRVGVAMVAAFMMGWLLFEPFVLTGAGVAAEDAERARELVGDVLQRMGERSPRGRDR